MRHQNLAATPKPFGETQIEVLGAAGFGAAKYNATPVAPRTAPAAKEIVETILVVL